MKEAASSKIEVRRGIDAADFFFKDPLEGRVRVPGRERERDR